MNNTEARYTKETTSTVAWSSQEEEAAEMHPCLDCGEHTSIEEPLCWSCECGGTAYSLRGKAKPSAWKSNILYGQYMAAKGKQGLLEKKIKKLQTELRLVGRHRETQRVIIREVLALNQ